MREFEGTRKWSGYYSGQNCCAGSGNRENDVHWCTGKRYLQVGEQLSSHTVKKINAFSLSKTGHNMKKKTQPSSISSTSSVLLKLSDWDFETEGNFWLETTVRQKEKN
ncbi:hypothetical protein CDAR_90971 [Caerostris darwini]|uniref:Uncharacterized protein n=1 Tax=Caerostris darwini TaxID=1538125 RepID=A0AAV4Q7C4_9ARAC|nr:hypothetical protein CDAR_90971 [Caerostris darwini]